MANTLFLRLEGPLQSWGERAHWSIRDTAPEPTKSGVVGLLGCALGLRSDEALQGLSQQIQMAVRCDRPGTLLVDYHTVGGGYETPQLLTAKGKPKKNHTEPTERHYLSGASFLVAIQAENAMVKRLAAAVQNPHWVVFLGRKSCPPSRPLLEGTGDFASLREALETWPWRRADVEKPQTVAVRAVLESRPHEGVRRRHEIISRTHRVFGPRYTRDVRLQIEVVPEEVS